MWIHIWDMYLISFVLTQLHACFGEHAVTGSDGNMEPTPPALAGDSQPLKGRPTDSLLSRRVMSHQKLKKGAGRRGVERGRPHEASPGDTILREPSVEGQRVHRGVRAGGGFVSPSTPTHPGRTSRTPA